MTTLLVAALVSIGFFLVMMGCVGLFKAAIDPPAPGGEVTVSSVSLFSAILLVGGASSLWLAGTLGGFN